MSIRLRLLISSVLFIAFAVGIGLILILESQSLEKKTDRTMANVLIRKSSFELIILTHDYLTHPEERPLMQWQMKHESLGRLLSRVVPADPSDAEIIDRLKANHDQIKNLFSRLTANSKKPDTNSGHFQPSKELEERLTGMLSIALQIMASDASQLTRASQLEMISYHKRMNLLITSVVGLMVCIMVANLFWIRRAIVKPLTELAAGAKIIGSGNLDHIVNLKGRDETGQLAAAFNAMTENLKQSYQALQQEISERKRAEAALKKKADELARSNKDLEQFAYVASHDLQEPLRNVSSCMQLLERRYKDNMGPDVAKLMNYAVGSVIRMKALIEDLLAYSRVETRGKPLVPTDCEAVFSRALGNLRWTIADSQALITHDPLPTVSADPTQLTQVFQNLISNAVKFRREEPPKVHCSAARNGNEWIFSVQDNGIGIEPKYSDRIFQIFQRLHTVAEYEGTGIGLAIAKKIIERHGGRIWMESVYGAGTTFYFTIPGRGVENS